MHCISIVAEQKSQRAMAALAMETRAGCGCLGADQCAHPVWLLTVSLTVSSLFSMAHTDWSNGYY